MLQDFSLCILPFKIHGLRIPDVTLARFSLQSFRAEPGFPKGDPLHRIYVSLHLTRPARAHPTESQTPRLSWSGVVRAHEDQGTLRRPLSLCRQQRC